MNNKLILTVIYTLSLFLYAELVYSQNLIAIENVEGIYKLRDLPLIYSSHPCFSPNGRFLAFRSDHLNGYALRVLDTEKWGLVEIGYDQAPTNIQWLNDDIISLGYSSKSAHSYISLTAKGPIVDESEVSKMESILNRGASYDYDTKTNKLSFLSNQVYFYSIPAVKYFENFRVSPSKELFAFFGTVDESFKAQHSLCGTSGIFIINSRTNDIKLAGQIPLTYSGLPSEATTSNNPEYADDWYPAHSYAFSPDEKFLLCDSCYCVYDLKETNLNHWVSLWIEEIATGDKKQLTSYEPSVSPYSVIAWSSTGLICYSKDSTQLSFYRLKLKQPQGMPSGE